MRINTNISSLNAWRNLSATDSAMSKNLERLSSGYRINRAADDVAGLAISENMRAQITGLNQAVKNAQDGTSLLQTAEGSLNEVHTMLQRMRELAVQSANGTLQPEDRKQIQTEMDNLTKEVTRITNATQFNSKDLIDGSLQDGNIQSVTLQIGPNGGQTVNFAINAMDAKSLGIGRDVTTGEVDNGLGRTTTVDSLVNSDITGGFTYNTGLSATKDYQILADNTNGYKLQSSSDGGKTWSDVGAWQASAASVTVGSGTEQVTFTTSGAGPAAGVTNAVAARVYNNNSGFVTNSFGNMGAGLAAGNYTVNYDSNTQTVQLKDSTGAKVGDAINIAGKAGQTITLGDAYTARTMDITLKSFSPSQSMTDKVTIGSTSAHVTTDAASPVLASGSGAVTNVGTGLTAQNYQVAFVGGNVQLQDMSGNAIGAAVAFAANGTVTIGDAATQRTVDVKLAAAAPGVPSAAVITVTNNGQSAQAATFSGGVKRTSAQAFAGLNVSSANAASDAIELIDKAIGMVSYQRSQLGALQNRLDHTVNNLQVVSENLTASESRIRDVDMALEMTQFTKHQILMQSGTAMLAQANQKNQAVLSLLR